MQQVGGAAKSGWRAQKAPTPRPVATLRIDTADRLYSAPEVRRGKARPRRRSRRVSHVILPTVLAALSGVLVFTILTDGGQRARSFESALPSFEEIALWAGFGIAQVELAGHRFTTDGSIFDALDLENARSMASFDSVAARARIERLPWVATAAITRAFPNTLDIRVTERKPAAIWQRGTHEYLIDATGRMLSLIESRFDANLPRIAGEGAAEEAKGLFAALARFPQLAERYELAERVAERRWTLRLKNSITVHLPADGEAHALAQLSQDEDLQRLLKRRDVVIDLRTPRRITVRATHNVDGERAADTRAGRAS